MYTKCYIEEFSICSYLEKIGTALKPVKSTLTEFLFLCK